MMNLSHLRYFVDAARAKSLSEAARKNRVSQSAVSQALKSLERDLGVQLTTHQKKVFHLTEEGRLVLSLADQIFSAVELLRIKIESQTDVLSGRVSLGCTNSLATRLVTAALGQLCTEFPQLRPRLLIGNSETLKEWLLKDEIDVALMLDSGPLPKGLEEQSLGTGEYVLFHSAKGSARLCRDRLVATRAERDEVQAVLRHAKKMEVFCELTSWEAIRNFVLESPNCCGLCPDYVVSQDLRQGDLKKVSLEIKMPKYKLIAVHRAHLGKTASMVLKHLRGLSFHKL